MPDSVRRIEVLTGAGRRRSCSPAEEAAIIAERYDAGETVCGVARCHGLYTAAVVRLAPVGGRPCIVRQLSPGFRYASSAVNHDTSVMMIERTYSRFIGDHADALTRAALLDRAERVAGKDAAQVAGTGRDDVINLAERRNAG